MNQFYISIIIIYYQNEPSGSNNNLAKLGDDPLLNFGVVI